MEADKKSQMERLMRDMNVGDAGPSKQNRNPFGPHPKMNDGDEE